MPPVTLQRAFEIAMEHHQSGRLGEAEALYRQILAVLPHHAGALHLLGVLAHTAGQHAAAVSLIQQALALDPQNASVHSDLGEACLALDRADEAIAHYRRAIALDPRLAAAHFNLANALHQQGCLDEAVAEFRAAFALNPHDPRVLSNLSSTVAEQGHLDEAIATCREVVRLLPGEPAVHSNLISLLRLHPSADRQALAEAQREWGRQFADPHRSPPPLTNSRDPARRLRIGYVSPDFRIHATLFFLAPLFREHDHRQFEIHCYASVARPDEGTEHLRQLVDVWHDVRHLSDADLAATIRADEIDILVDLSMHTSGNRLPLFARKRAPVLVCWLAYAGATGLVAMDYRITDRHFDPPAPADPSIAEKPVHLPDSWCCYQPFLDDVPVNALPALSAGHVTFGCLNNFLKLSEDTLTRFARVLQAVERSRLILLAPQGSARSRVTDFFRQHGIESDRIEYAVIGSRSAYLRHYHRIDLALDTLPHNGMATTCETLWMGVPVITQVGDTIEGRAGLSLLSTIGLPDLITHSADEFVATARRLAADLPTLAERRANMRAEMQASPLMDAPRFARNMEAAYREVWGRWCEMEGGRYNSR
ncbi:MAG TPA: tetratricopeptide repeat protein [Chthoniobacter sp.]|nr:tetratricopeptide repeat protein [Chthoniobacter sp.]